MPIQSSVTGPWALVTLSGEFDAANSSTILAEVAELVARGASDVTLDMSTLTFIDASGINALMAVHHLIANTAGRMLLIGVNAFTARMLNVAGLGGVLSVFTASIPEPPNEAPGTLRSPEDEFTRGFYELSQLLVSDQTLAEDLDRIVQSAVAVVPGCTAGSIALVAKGDPRTAASSSRIAMEVDVAQYVTGEGPCLDAAHYGHRVRLDVLAADHPYKHFAALAIKPGIRSTLSLPILLSDQLVGSLNLYSTDPDAFDEGAEAMADVLAAQAATAIHRSLLYEATRRLTDRLQRHSDDYSDVMIAEGALSALHYCSLEQAHGLLRSAARANEESMAAAARRILDQLAKEPPLV
ncbi:MAG: putative sensor protein [Acidimicrobiaceae bacterium]|nr:putative sensor protein [Acidimicrobiaceae bacterium]